MSREYKCLQCHEPLPPEKLGIPIIIEMHSNIISLGFAGEEEPRHSFPFAIGIPKYHSCFGGQELYISMMQGFFADEMQILKGVLKILDITEKGTIIRQEYFLQMMFYCFEKVLHINPVNHPLVISNSFLTNKEQRDLLAALFFDVFGIPKLFMSSHQYFGILGTGESSGLSIELDHDMIIVAPVYQQRVMTNALSMDQLTPDILRQEQEDLRAAARAHYIIKTITQHLKSTLDRLEPELRNEVGSKVIIYDLRSVVNNPDKLILRLQNQLEDYNIKNAKIQLQIDNHVDGISWKGASFFLRERLMGYKWITNPEYLEPVNPHQLSSINQNDALNTIAKNLLENKGKYDRYTKKRMKNHLIITADEIYAAATLQKINYLDIVMKKAEDFRKLSVFRYNRSLRGIYITTKNKKRLHKYPRIDSEIVNQLDAQVVFTEQGIGLYRIMD